MDFPWAKREKAGVKMFRRATKEDIPAIENLLEQVLLVHHNGRADIFKEKGQKYTIEKLEEIIADDLNPVFVAENSEGVVVAHCFCQIVDRPESPATYAYKTLYIDDLCVDENARGQKIGSSLYDYVRRYARENGYYNVTLHAWECNPDAVGFYKHIGMRIQQYTMEEVL